MKEKYFRIFFGICLLTMSYGFDTIKQSHDNQVSAVSNSDNYQDALRVNTAKSREVLDVATRIMKASANLNQNPLTEDVLANMIQTAFDDDQINVASLINLNYLSAQIKRPGTAGDSRFAADIF